MLNAAYEQFLQHLKYERGMSPHTLRNYASDLEQFRGHLLAVEGREDFPVEQIDRLTIREWMASLDASGAKKTTRARKLASLRTFFQFLIREGKLEANPAKLVATPRVERKLPSHLSIEDAVDLDSDLRDAVRSRDFARALRLMTLLARHDDAARLARAILAEIRGV